MHFGLRVIPVFGYQSRRFSYVALNAAAGISWQYFLNMFMREALKKICHEIPAAESVFL